MTARSIPFMFWLTISLTACGGLTGDELADTEADLADDGKADGVAPPIGDWVRPQAAANELSALALGGDHSFHRESPGQPPLDGRWQATRSGSTRYLRFLDGSGALIDRWAWTQSAGALSLRKVNTSHWFVLQPAGASDDPFDPASCTDAPLTIDDVRSRFAPGEIRAELGPFQIATRGRSCNSVSGCSAWQDGWSWLGVSVHAGEFDGSLGIAIQPDGRIALYDHSRGCWMADDIRCGNVGDATMTCPPYERHPSLACSDPGYRLRDPYSLRFAGTVGRHCTRLTQRVQQGSAPGGWNEFEAVLTARY